MKKQIRKETKIFENGELKVWVTLPKNYSYHIEYKRKPKFKFLGMELFFN